MISLTQTILPFVGWAIFGAIIVVIIKYIIKKEVNKRNENPVIETLKMRYAKGKITKEEFEEKKKDLENNT